MDLKTEIWAKIGLEPSGDELEIGSLSLYAGIWVLRLGLGALKLVLAPQGWNLCLGVGIWALRLELGLEADTLGQGLWGC